MEVFAIILMVVLCLLLVYEGYSLVKTIIKARKEHKKKLNQSKKKEDTNV